MVPGHVLAQLLELDGVECVVAAVEALVPGQRDEVVTGGHRPHVLRLLGLPPRLWKRKVLSHSDSHFKLSLDPTQSFC